ncbi:MAG TPA: 30S ribosomal protein S17 [bacterium]|jgi:small subunit ribosomal protein S17|nr:30S ribosomal protein S17 [bacterium]
MASDNTKPASRVKTAVVVSRKMDKTAVVAIERLVKHPLYHKLIRKRSKFKIHDPKNETQKGDVVLITETRPISADKHWRLVKIVKKAIAVEEAKL